MTGNNIRRNPATNLVISYFFVCFVCFVLLYTRDGAACLRTRVSILQEIRLCPNSLAVTTILREIWRIYSLPKNEQ
jgi:hypothetical protein